MTDYKASLLKLYNNLQILQEREAKYGGNTPLDLVNQINDHHQAINLTEQADRGELSEAEWQTATKPLLAFSGGQVVNIEAQTYVAGDQHIHQRANLVLAIILGLIATMATVLAVPGVSGWVYGLFTPLPFAPAAEGVTLIVIANFHYPEGVAHTEAHAEIHRAIEQAKTELGITDTLRVEVEPTTLFGDDQDAARKLGDRYNAAIVIWGEDTGVRVTINFLNLKQPAFENALVKISETERTQLADPSAYAKFITTDLPAQLTFLALFAVGRSYFIQEEYMEAIKVYTKVIELKPDDADIYNNRGVAYYASGDLEKASMDFNKAIQLKPNLAEAYIGQGLVYAASDNLEQAIKEYTKAIELKPDYAGAYNNRGLAYSASGDLENAIADFTQAIELKPDYAEAYVSRGFAYATSNDLKQAIADFTQAIELKPDDAIAYTNRGAAYKDSSDPEKAITDFNKAIQLKPDFAEAYNNRGAAYGTSGDQKQAITNYNKAIQLKPDFAGAYNNRGLAYSASGNLKKAIADYTQAIQLKPDYAEA
ncbi:MAG: tetratricopeptide repeat protein, partial [Anaerolineae bacterium]|nr:tetratricopeptide repeat protein [Anaerolineae bacterium]